MCINKVPGSVGGNANGLCLSCAVSTLCRPFRFCRPEVLRTKVVVAGTTRVATSEDVVVDVGSERSSTAVAGS